MTPRRTHDTYFGYIRLKDGAQNQFTGKLNSLIFQDYVKDLSVGFIFRVNVDSIDFDTGKKKK